MSMFNSCKTHHKSAVKGEAMRKAAAVIIIFAITPVLFGCYPKYDLENKYNVPATIDAEIMELWTGKASASVRSSISGGGGLLIHSISGFLSATYSEEPIWASLKFTWPNGEVCLTDVIIPRAILIQYANAATIPLTITVVLDAEWARNSPLVQSGGVVTGLIARVKGSNNFVAAAIGVGDPNKWDTLYYWDGVMESAEEK